MQTGLWISCLLLCLKLPIAWHFTGTWTVHELSREIRISLCIYWLRSVVLLPFSSADPEFTLYSPSSNVATGPDRKDSEGIKLQTVVQCKY